MSESMNHHHHSDHGGIFYHNPEVCEILVKVMKELESDMHQTPCSEDQCAIFPLQG
jgi:hypothetical protein